MAYAFRAASTQGNASGGALTVSKPTGTVNGDLIVVVGYLESDTNTWSSVGSGFTSAGSFTNTGSFKMQVWWKIAASEPASWTWTPTSSNWRTVHAASWSGALGTGTTRVDVFGTSGQADGANETVQTAPSITPTVTGDLLVFAYGNFGGATATSLTGAATGLRANAGGLIIGSNESATTSATGTTRPVSTGTQDYAAIHVAFFLDTGGSGAQTVVASALDASSAPGSGTVVVREQYVATTAYDASTTPGSGTVVTAVATVVATAYDGGNTPGSGTIVVQQVQTLAYDGSSTPGSPSVIQTIITLAYDGSSTPGNATVQPGNVDVQTAAYDGSTVPGSGTVVLLADAIVLALAYDGSNSPGAGTIVSGGTIIPPPDVGYRQPR